MNTKEDLFFIRKDYKNIVGTKAQLLDLIGKSYIEDSITLQRVYTVEEYEREAEKIPF